MCFIHTFIPVDTRWVARCSVDVVRHQTACAVWSVFNGWILFRPPRRAVEFSGLWAGRIGPRYPSPDHRLANGSICNGKAKALNRAWNNGQSIGAISHRRSHYWCIHSGQWLKDVDVPARDRDDRRRGGSAPHDNATCTSNFATFRSTIEADHNAVYSAREQFVPTLLEACTSVYTRSPSNRLQIQSDIKYRSRVSALTEIKRTPLRATAGDARVTHRLFQHHRFVARAEFRWRCAPPDSATRVTCCRATPGRHQHECFLHWSRESTSISMAISGRSFDCDKCLGDFAATMIVFTSRIRQTTCGG